jgi:hypothetical protein
MKTSLDCIPCFLRQALEAARFMTNDPVTHERIIRVVLRDTAEIDLAKSPPLLARVFYRWLEEMAGVEDLYRPAKDRFNRLALDLLPDLQLEVTASSDPLATALRLAIAGNMIDFGVKGTITEEEVRQAIGRAFQAPFSGDVEDFRQAVGEAQRILYLADNAGEIVLDRLLIGQLPQDRVVLVVRGRPVINDATMVDAQSVGLTGLVEVIDNGSDIPGTAVSECSSAFQQRFAEADLVIAKGQGNFETLSDEPGNIFFLFKVKCPVVSSHVGLTMGTHVLVHSSKLALP